MLITLVFFNVFILHHLVQNNKYNNIEIFIYFTLFNIYGDVNGAFTCKKNTWKKERDANILLFGQGRLLKRKENSKSSEISWHCQHLAQKNAAIG
jgi:hypothetical protein